jgi:hypothetical protein
MSTSGLTTFNPATKFAYVHCRPDGSVFYVGKGAHRRVKNLRERNEYHKRVVAKYGKENILIGMLECSSEAISLELERGIIKCLKQSGVRLTNCTDGGEKGTVLTEETKAKLSKAAKKRGVSAACRAASVIARKGKPLTEEQKRRQSESMKGIVFTEGHRINISKSAKKRGMSQTLIKAAHKANKGRVQPKEEKQKRSVALLAYWDVKGRKPKKIIDPAIRITTSMTNLDIKLRPVIVDGVYYATSKEAAKIIGVTPSAIIYALKHSGYTKGYRIEEVEYGN